MKRDFRSYLANELEDYENARNWNKEAQEKFMHFMNKYSDADAIEGIEVVEDMLERRSGKGPQMIELLGNPALLQKNDENTERQKKQAQLAKWHNERIQGIINQERERREKNKIFDPIERRAIESFPEGAQQIFRNIKNADK